MSDAGESFWAGLPFGRGVTLITRDPNGVAALAKPEGVLSHPNAAGDELRALLTARYDLEGEFYEWSVAGGTQRLWLLNRIDSVTSGVILVAADEVLAREIKLQFRRKQVRKVYHALVFGRPPLPVQLWRDLIEVQKSGGRIRASAGAGHMTAECQMSVVRASKPGANTLAHIRLAPRTGRSHQLRVQCAKRNLPIVGDQTYGDFQRNREFAKLTGVKRMLLHSLETGFDYEWQGRRFAFTAKAPLPAEFSTLV